MTAEQYDKHKAEALANCVRRAVATLKEHCDSFSISCVMIDSQGVTYTHEAEWNNDDEDDDDDDDKKQPT